MRITKLFPQSQSCSSLSQELFRMTEQINCFTSELNILRRAMGKSYTENPEFLTKDPKPLREEKSG